MNEKYITHEEAEKDATPWQLVDLRIREYGYEVAANGLEGAGHWLAKNRLLEAISAYSKSQKPAS